MSSFDEKADFLNNLANAQRLRVLSILLDGEISVGPLAETIGLSQSALSQHLAKLRASKIVTTRREAQVIFYSIKSEKVAAVLGLLDELFKDVGPEKLSATANGKASGVGQSNAPVSAAGQNWPARSLRR